MTTLDDEPLLPGMIHETIVASRTDQGWRFFEFQCLPSQVLLFLGGLGLMDHPHRILVHHHIKRGLHGYFTKEYARREGWTRDPQTGEWFPMDELLPRLPGSPQKGDFSLALKYIYLGGIRFNLKANDENIETFIDDIDDSLFSLVKFVQVLANGGYPHGAICHGSSYEFIIQPEIDDAYCRLYIRLGQSKDASIIDILVNQSKLIDEFKNFLLAVADHINFGHGFMYFDSISDKEYDKAEAEWDKSIKGADFFKLDETEQWHVEHDFIAHHIARHVRLPKNFSNHIEKFRAMLKTLQIPFDLEIPSD